MGTVPLDLHTVHRHRLFTLQHDVYCGVQLAAQQCVQIVQRQPPHVLTVDGHDEIAIPGGMPYPGDDSPASNSFSILYKLLHTGQTTTTTHQGD